jgi:CBS domain
MTIASILHVKGADVATILPSTTVREAVHLFQQQRIGAVIVVDGVGKPVGVLSELGRCGFGGKGGYDHVIAGDYGGTGSDRSASDGADDEPPDQAFARARQGRFGWHRFHW